MLLSVQVGAPSTADYRKQIVGSVGWQIDVESPLRLRLDVGVFTKLISG
jgi:hypothetical protein